MLEVFSSGSQLITEERNCACTCSNNSLTSEWDYLMPIGPRCWYAVEIDRSNVDYVNWLLMLFKEYCIPRVVGLHE